MKRPHFFPTSRGRRVEPEWAPNIWDENKASGKVGSTAPTPHSSVLTRSRGHKAFPIPTVSRLPKKPHHSSQNPVHEARLRREEDVPWGSAFSIVSHGLALHSSVLGYAQGKEQNTERKLLEMPSYCILGIHIKSIKRKWPSNVNKKWVRS